MDKEIKIIYDMLEKDLKENILEMDKLNPLGDRPIGRTPDFDSGNVGSSPALSVPFFSGYIK